MLTEKQQKVFDDFLDAVKNKQILVLSSHQRNIGKTYTLNELAFSLQALGYIVFILTPFKSQDYFAHRFLYDYIRDLCGLDMSKIVIIADEVMYWDNKNIEIFKHCQYYQIPIVGYVNYS